MKETQLDGESLDIVSDNVSKLKEIFPEVITEDKIDFDKLKLILGSDIDTDSERYSFTWPGKTQAIKESQKQSTGTLRPCKEESKNWETTKNLYIEGDNLEVLKLLQKGYYNKIKAIYIDPPYNTGNDFIYKDVYKDNLANYLEVSGQTGDGQRLTTNTESDGRFHSNWLNMMYPRLKLARNLLKNEGIIFISIDDNEVENLKKICNEIFGEENFIGQFNWYKSETPPNLSRKIKKNIEYILVYEKIINNLKYGGIQKFSKSDNGLLNQTNSIKTLIFPKNIVQTKLNNQILRKGKYGTENYDVISFGCGCSTDEFTRKLLEQIHKNRKNIPTVIDADGLNVLASSSLMFDKNTILTPHPLEAARLLGITIDEILEVSSEKWIRDNVYSKIIEKMKKDGIIERGGKI